MVFVDAAGQAENGSSRILIPVRCAKAGKRRNTTSSRSCRSPSAPCTRNPPRTRSASSHRAATGLRLRRRKWILERIRNLVPDAPCNRGNKTVCRRNRLFSRVHQQEAACSVCIFRFARRIAGLAEQRRLLVSRCSRNRNRAAEIWMPSPRRHSSTGGLPAAYRAECSVFLRYPHPISGYGY